MRCFPLKITLIIIAVTLPSWSIDQQQAGVPKDIEQRVIGGANADLQEMPFMGAPVAADSTNNSNDNDDVNAM